MLLYEETKAFEKVLGPEATELLAKVFERHDFVSREGLATKEDLFAVRSELKEDNANIKHDLLKWMLGSQVALAALLVAVMAFLR